MRIIVASVSVMRLLSNFSKVKTWAYTVGWRADKRHERFLGPHCQKYVVAVSGSLKG